GVAVRVEHAAPGSDREQRRRGGCCALGQGIGLRTRGSRDLIPVEEDAWVDVLADRAAGRRRGVVDLTQRGRGAACEARAGRLRRRDLRRRRRLLAGFGGGGAAGAVVGAAEAGGVVVDTAVGGRGGRDQVDGDRGAGGQVLRAAAQHLRAGGAGERAGRGGA